MAEDELLELILAFLPDYFGSCMTTVVAICAILSYVLPPPAEEAHPAWRMVYRVVCIFGLGAAKIRAAGRFGRLLRRKGGKK